MILEKTDISSNMIIQYSIVGLVLLAASIWILWKIFRNKDNKNKSCCGCSLADSCQNKQIKKKYHGENKNL